VARPSQVIILGEDQRHQRFVQKYLKRFGYSYHDLYNVDLPSGRGCGEQWVRGRYVESVKAYRARSARANTALVVAIDANGGDVARRLRQLREGLAEAGLPPRGDTEKIVHLVPKRSIETWILCLTGQDVDESTDYSRESTVDRQISSAADELFEWTRPNAVQSVRCVPSLLSSIPELTRLG
jgi:hypothetical protein